MHNSGFKSIIPVIAQPVVTVQILVVADFLADATTIVDTLIAADNNFRYDISKRQTSLTPIADQGQSLVGLRQTPPPDNYDVIVYRHCVSDDIGLLIEKLQQWRNCYPQTSLVLVTEPLGDEGAIKCAQCGINGYVLIEKLASLPAIVEQSIASLDSASANDCQMPSASFSQVNVEFLSHLTHELRTPLTAILGFSRSLMDEIFGKLNAKQMQYVSAISTSGQHLLDLVNDFLDFSKIDADREQLYLERVAVQDLCQAALSMVEVCARQEKLKLNLKIEPDVNICVCDQLRIKQILINLLSNAIKFTEVGSIILKVERSQDKINFAVIDTGVGITPENQQKLFQPFFQINSRRRQKYKGTGLGLALSRRLAQLHGGDLTVKSTPGQGSCFTLSIPDYLSQRPDSNC